MIKDELKTDKDKKIKWTHGAHITWAFIGVSLALKYFNLVNTPWLKIFQVWFLVFLAEITFDLFLLFLISLFATIIKIIKGVLKNE